MKLVKADFKLVLCLAHLVPPVGSLYFSCQQYVATEIKMLFTDAQIVKPTLVKNLTNYVVTTALVSDNSLLYFKK